MNIRRSVLVLVLAFWALVTTNLEAAAEHAPSADIKVPLSVLPIDTLFGVISFLDLPDLDSLRGVNRELSALVIPFESGELRVTHPRRILFLLQRIQRIAVVSLVLDFRNVRLHRADLHLIQKLLNMVRRVQRVSIDLGPREILSRQLVNLARWFVAAQQQMGLVMIEVGPSAGTRLFGQMMAMLHPPQVPTPPDEEDIDILHVDEGITEVIGIPEAPMALIPHLRLNHVTELPPPGRYTRQRNVHTRKCRYVPYIAPIHGGNSMP